jgi:hypothetical protein
MRSSVTSSRRNLASVFCSMVVRSSAIRSRPARRQVGHVKFGCRCISKMIPLPVVASPHTKSLRLATERNRCDEMCFADWPKKAETRSFHSPAAVDDGLSDRDCLPLFGPHERPCHNAEQHFLHEHVNFTATCLAQIERLRLLKRSGWGKYLLITNWVRRSNSPNLWVFPKHRLDNVRDVLAVQLWSGCHSGARPALAAKSVITLAGIHQEYPYVVGPCRGERSRNGPANPCAATGDEHCRVVQVHGRRNRSMTNSRRRCGRQAAEHQGERGNRPRIGAERKMTFDQIDADAMDPENHAAMGSLSFMYYNVGRVHQTLRVTPAMEAPRESRLVN